MSEAKKREVVQQLLALIVEFHAMMRVIEKSLDFQNPLL